MFMKHDPRMAFEMKSKNGRTPAHTASLHGHLNILKCLIRFDPTGDTTRLLLNSRDNCGNNVFMDALLADNLEIVRYLIENHKVGIYLKFKRNSSKKNLLFLFSV